MKPFKIKNTLLPTPCSVPTIEPIIVHVDEKSRYINTLLESMLVEVCEGNSGAKICDVKERLNEFLKTKKLSNIATGAVAELFIHLILKDHGYRQECLFFNLEEGSIKKGFDGYYSSGDEEWIMESKSGSISTKDISHVSKVLEAYNDLSDKLAGKVKTGGKRLNNPWRNAYNHAQHADVGTNKSIVKNIQTFASKYQKGDFGKIIDFNVIPCSTIFLENIPDSAEKFSIIKVRDNLYSYPPLTRLRESHKKMLIVCVTHESIDLFYKFLTS